MTIIDQIRVKYKHLKELDKTVETCHKKIESVNDEVEQIQHELIKFYRLRLSRLGVSVPTTAELKKKRRKPQRRKPKQRRARGRPPKERERLKSIITDFVASSICPQSFTEILDFLELAEGKRRSESGVRPVLRELKDEGVLVTSKMHKPRQDPSRGDRIVSVWSISKAWEESEEDTAEISNQEAEAPASNEQKEETQQSDSTHSRLPTCWVL